MISFSLAFSAVYCKGGLLRNSAWQMPIFKKDERPMKAFFQGASFGLLFSLIAMLCFRFCPWQVLPNVSAALFILGGGAMGGLFHLLLGSMLDVRSDAN